jgi:hypothetical protein
MNLLERASHLAIHGASGSWGRRSVLSPVAFALLTSGKQTGGVAAPRGRPAQPVPLILSRSSCPAQVHPPRHTSLSSSLCADGGDLLSVMFEIFHHAAYKSGTTGTCDAHGRADRPDGRRTSDEQAPRPAGGKDGIRCELTPACWTALTEGKQSKGKPALGKPHQGRARALADSRRELPDIRRTALPPGITPVRIRNRFGPIRPRWRGTLPPCGIAVVASRRPIHHGAVNYHGSGRFGGCRTPDGHGWRRTGRFT